MSQQPTTDEHRNKARELYERHYKNEREREDRFSKEVKKKRKRRKENGVN